jgi:ATP-dependent exoDNAse (exonuclease V) beta subunit
MGNAGAWLAKTRFVEDLHRASKYVLAKTELLVYSLELRMAGQVDLLMRNEDSTEYHILDYKFIKEPLEKELLQQIYSEV